VRNTSRSFPEANRRFSGIVLFAYPLGGRGELGAAQPSYL